MIKIIKLSILNVTRNQIINKAYIILISTLTTVMTLSFCMSYMLNEYLEYNLNENKEARQIILKLNNEHLELSEKKIIKNLSKYEFVETIDSSISSVNSSSDSYIYLTIRNYKDINYAKKILSNENYIVLSNSSVESENKIITNIKLIINIMLILIIILIFITINIIVKQSISERFYDIAIYKSVGYKDKYLFQLFCFESILLIIPSYIYSIILTILILYIGSSLVINKLNLSIQVNGILYSCIWTLVLLCSIILPTSFIATKKTKKIPVKALFNE